MKVRFYLDTGYVGADHEEIIKLPDSFTDDQIESEFQGWAWEQISGYWEKVVGNEDDA